MQATKATATIHSADYEAKLSAFVAEERAKLMDKPIGFFGNWAFHASKQREFDKRLKAAGIRVVAPSSTATPGTFVSTSRRWNGDA